MTDTARSFQYTSSSVPKAYDEFLVPRLFEPWAKLLLDEANLRAGEAVLDIATGPGTVARLAAVRVGPNGQVVATDIAQPMLDVAKAKGPLANAAAIEYLQSPATPMAAPSGSFDVVMCNQGLQFFPDRAGALREMHRVLKPNGRAAIAVWGQLERNPIFAAYHAALRATVPSELAELATAPCSWPSGTALKAAAEEAGFGEIRLLTPTLLMEFEGGLDQAIQSFAGTPLAPSIAALPKDVQKAFVARVRHEMTPLLQGGKVIGEMNSNVIIAYY
jgi:ubiquinone/menaquinone biosynthesis C-methylase UbiE